MTPDPIMAEIMAAIALLHGGDRVGARGKFEAIWARIAADPQPMHECVLSHYMADAQDKLAEELAWDIRALDAALRCTEDEAKRHGPGLSIAAFMPSLHTNLADDYFRLGDLARSRERLAAARACSNSLGDDGYGQLIRGGIERLAARLEAARD
jgi:hypothetical protein